jgi:hypothetical protein
MASIGALFVTYLVCSSLIVPDLVNKSLVEGNSLSSGRYGITFPAIESIGELESDAIVTIGSSILNTLPMALASVKNLPRRTLVSTI